MARLVHPRMWLSICAAGIVLAICGIWVCSPTSSIAAPPPVRSLDRPFDSSWSDVYLILANKCTGCHRPGTKRMDLTSYESVMSAKDEGMRLVVPGDAENSLLWGQLCWNSRARVNSRLPGKPEMPPKRDEWLTTGQQETIRRWIDSGAHPHLLSKHHNEGRLTEADFPSAKQCAACHPKQYAEWSRSMHAYAQHSPITEAFNLTLVEKTSGTIGTFCTRCHTPVGTALGEPGTMRNVHRSRISMEGVTCIVCHRRKSGRYKASGRVRVEPGKLMDTCIFGPFDDAVQMEGTHPTRGLPYIKSAQFCGECHDVTSPGGIRLEEAFSEWQNSPAAKSGITCQQCHMGPVQGVPIPDLQRPLGRAAVVPGVDPEKIPLRRLSDHTFAGPDYSLLPDTEFPHKLEWMYEKDYTQTSRLTPHEQRSLQRLRRSNREHLRIADAKRYELLRNAAEIKVSHPTTATAGGHIDVVVSVFSKVAGHSIPTGFTAERQLWVSIEVRDPQERLVFASGDLDSNFDLRDDHSHDVVTGKIRYDRHLMNLQSKFIALTNKGTERPVVVSVNRHLAPLNILRPATGIPASFGRGHGFRIAKGSLPPLATRTKKYPVRFPNCEGVYAIDVRLNFRHLPPTLLDHVGVPNLKPQLEIVVIDSYSGVIHVGPK